MFADEERNEILDLVWRRSLHGEGCPLSVFPSSLIISLRAVMIIKVEEIQNYSLHRVFKLGVLHWHRTLKPLTYAVWYRNRFGFSVSGVECGEHVSRCRGVSYVQAWHVFRGENETVAESEVRGSMVASTCRCMNRRKLIDGRISKRGRSYREKIQPTDRLLELFGSGAYLISDN